MFRHCRGGGGGGGGGGEDLIKKFFVNTVRVEIYIGLAFTLEDVGIVSFQSY